MKHRAWREDFPFFKLTPYCYLDSAATSLKPQCVIDTVSTFYQEETANLARGEHLLTYRVTERIEQTREGVAQLIGAHPHEIIFTFSATDSLNMIAKSIMTNQQPCIVSTMNHHAALLPFMQSGPVRYVKDDQGQIDLDNFRKLCQQSPLLMVVPWVCNANGNQLPIKQMCDIAKEYGVMTVVDAAQSVGHMPVDVDDLGCDFLAFSAHKALGPSAVGVLYARVSCIEKLQPMRLGGGIVSSVTQEAYQLRVPPYRFEAGTPNLEGIIGFGAGLDYLHRQGIGQIVKHLNQLEAYATQQFSTLDCVKPTFAYTPEHAPIFNLTVTHPSINTAQLSMLLAERFNIITNYSQHCCQPLYLTHHATDAMRVSFYLYNEKEDIDLLVNAINEILG
ncbi:aminotransferase class V-fold PLP-dependent enzyme [Legionella sp. W05-934-2]|uniref:aminotransferase class V-fold PLP-dependent enzyme n=1 Tax=Legionella sp. W05-934-2 TaxID=1198649 RepID=UPI003462BD7F